MIVAYRPQTEGVGYGNPFPKTEVPAGAPAGIRRNGDDDDKDTQPDYTDDMQLQQENDLIETRVKIATSATDGYLGYDLSANDVLRYFRNPSKGHSSRIPTTLSDPHTISDGETVWVEWAGGTAIASKY